MSSATTIEVTGTRSAVGGRVAHDTRATDLSAIRADLDALAVELRALWSSTLDGGDFDEVTRLVEASHAVHRAVVALSPDSLVPASRFPRRAAG